MQHSSTHTLSSFTAVATTGPLFPDRANTILFDYSDLLKAYQVEYAASGYYWQVGTIEKTQGWILHLSVIKCQLQALLELVIPVLLAEKVPFKIVRNGDFADCLLEGSLGYINLGKLVSIYPDDDQLALALAQKLMGLTGSFRGPVIQTDRRLGGIVYARYGSFNPELQKDQYSLEAVKCIYDHSGQLIPDPYTIPFQLPAGRTWPFQEIVPPLPPAPKELLHDKYHVTTILKPDAKGKVMLARFFTKFWLPKICLIKEGCENMMADDQERDMRDRIRWQFDLNKDLAGDIPMPKIFDLFEENGNVYLVMELIKGKSLTEWIGQIFKGRYWQDLSIPDRLKLVDKLIVILTIFQQLQKKGYVHRDATAENFLLDKKDDIFLIDIELAWLSLINRPNPPFKLGTVGYMSPEQRRIETPTIKEDIFALGGLIHVFFLNLSPIKIFDCSTERTKKNIAFFTGEKKIAELIANCRQTDPEKRPVLQALQTILQDYREQLASDPSDNQTPAFAPGCALEELAAILRAGIGGLSMPDLLTGEYCWLSRMQRQEQYIGNTQSELAVYDGWHTGVAGPLWLLGRAKKWGADTGSCEQAYRRNWAYMNDQPVERPGLYTGRAGIALALVEGIAGGWLTPDPENIRFLEECFSVSATELSLAAGMAGQGVALLSCAEWMDKDLATSLLQSYTSHLIGLQQPDGSWPLFANTGRKGDLITGLADGVAGIAWFLLSCCRRHPASPLTIPIKNAARKAMDWLIRVSKKRGKIYSWTISTKSSSLENTSVSLGMPGIILTFIRAYEIFQDPLYKQIAESWLTDIPPHLVLPDFRTETGLAGLGEIYLEAAAVFKNLQWEERADWIAQLFIHTFQYADEGRGRWAVDNSDIITADLFTGNGGILHFLLRRLEPETWSHPLG